jgi:hypothetical protein
MLKEGTLIQLEKTKKQIERINLREEVVSYDVESASFSNNSIVCSYYSNIVDSFSKITFENEEFLICGGHTKIYTKQRGIILVDNLRYGDMCLRLEIVNNKKIKQWVRVKYITFEDNKDEIFRFIQRLSGFKFFFANNYCIGTP